MRDPIDVCKELVHEELKYIDSRLVDAGKFPISHEVGVTRKAALENALRWLQAQELM